MDESEMDREALVESIEQATSQLAELRAERDRRILAAYAEGASKYRLALDWNLTQTHIKRLTQNSQ